MKFYGLYGAVEIKKIKFLILISKAIWVATINQKKIFKIKSIKFLAIDREKYKNGEFSNCWEYLEKIKKYLKSGFYFSYQYPLHLKFHSKIFD